MSRRSALLRSERRMAAIKWRRANRENPDRRELWSRYRHGAEWFGVDWQTHSEREAIRLGLLDAEIIVPYP